MLADVIRRQNVQLLHIIAKNEDLDYAELEKRYIGPLRNNSALKRVTGRPKDMACGLVAPPPALEMDSSTL